MPPTPKPAQPPLKWPTPPFTLAAIGMSSAGLGITNTFIGVVANFAEKIVKLTKPTAILTGDVPGWELSFAQAGIRCGVPVTLVLPYPRDTTFFPPMFQRQWDFVCSRVKENIVISEKQTIPSVYRRNAWMVDRCGLLLVTYAPDVFNDATAEVIEYAKAKIEPPMVVNCLRSYKEYVKCRSPNLV